MSYKDLYLAIVDSDLSFDDGLRLTAAEENADISTAPETDEWYQFVIVAFEQLIADAPSA